MTLSKKELEELLQIVKDKPLPIEDEQDIDPLDKVNKFILLFNIKEGKHKVFLELIHKVFNEWSKTPINKRFFGRCFCKFFEKKRTSKQSYYSLNCTANQLIKKAKQLEDKRDLL